MDYYGRQQYLDYYGRQQYLKQKKEWIEERRRKYGLLYRIDSLQHEIDALVERRNALLRVVEEGCIVQEHSHI